MNRSLHLRNITDNFDTFVNAERAAVEADVVIFGLAPVAVGVVLVIDLALAVLLLQHGGPCRSGRKCAGSPADPSG